MNVRRLQTILRSSSKFVVCSTRPTPRSVITQGCRTYATHQDPIPSSLLSSSLDQKPSRSRGHDSAGPFQLGVQPSMRSGEKVKKWAELSPGGKGMLRVPLSENLGKLIWIHGTVTRAAARSTNFTVILIGAGFSAMLLYALTSELFSRNSPTVLYGNACDRIENSKKVRFILCLSNY